MAEEKQKSAETAQALSEEEQGKVVGAISIPAEDVIFRIPPEKRDAFWAELRQCMFMWDIQQVASEFDFPISYEEAEYLLEILAVSGQQAKKPNPRFYPWVPPELL